MKNIHFLLHIFKFLKIYVFLKISFYEHFINKVDKIIKYNNFL